MQKVNKARCTRCDFTASSQHAHGLTNSAIHTERTAGNDFTDKARVGNDVPGDRAPSPFAGMTGLFCGTVLRWNGCALNRVMVRIWWCKFETYETTKISRKAVQLQAHPHRDGTLEQLHLPSDLLFADILRRSIEY